MEPYIFAAEYDGDQDNIYELLYDGLTDRGKLVEYFRTHQDKIDSECEKLYGFPKSEVQEYAQLALSAMEDVDDALMSVCEDIDDGVKTGFESLFFVHSKSDKRLLPGGGGESVQYGEEYLPVKCFGSKKPSLIRIYAIELNLKCYIVIYGGIKLSDTTSKCPDFFKNDSTSHLEEQLNKRFKTVALFLKGLGIIDAEGFEQYMEEDNSEDK